MCNNYTESRENYDEEGIEKGNEKEKCRPDLAGFEPARHRWVVRSSD